MLSFIKCFERVLIKIISDLFPDIPPYPWGGFLELFLLCNWNE